MDGGYPLLILSPLRVASVRLGKLALGFGETLLSAACVAGVIYWLTIGQISEMLKPNVDTHCFALWAEWAEWAEWVKLILNRKTTVPVLTVPPVSSDGDGLNLPAHRAMQLELEYRNLVLESVNRSLCVVHPNWGK